MSGILKRTRKQQLLEQKSRLHGLQIENNTVNIKHIGNDIKSLKEKSKPKCKKHGDEIKVPLYKSLDVGPEPAISKEKVHMAKNKTKQTPDTVIRELQKHADEISSEIWNYKNQNQLLRKQILCARKVIKQEVGGNSASFENIRKETDEKDWEGRKKMSIRLKDKLRDLKATVMSMEGHRPSTDNLKRHSCYPLPRKRSSSVDTISEERCNYWRLELERRHIIDKANQELNSIQSDYTHMKDKLKERNLKNVSMMNEVKTLREEICILVDKNNHDSDVIYTLQSYESDLKDELDKYWEIQHIIDSVKKSNSRHAKMIETTREQIALQKRNIEENELLISSLQDQEYRLKDIFELEKMRIHQGSRDFAQKLNEASQDYSEALQPLLELVSALADEREQIIEMMPDSLKAELWPVEVVEKEIDPSNIPPSEDIAQSSPASGGFEVGNDPLVEGDTTGEVNEELECCKTLYEAAVVEAHRMTQLIFVIIETLQERTEQLTSEERALYAKELELQLLRKDMENLPSHAKKKAVPTIKDKLEERALEEQLQMKYNIMIEENNFLVATLNGLLSSQENDFELCKAFTENNKDIFLNTLYHSEEPTEIIVTEVE